VAEMTTNKPISIARQEATRAKALRTGWAGTSAKPMTNPVRKYEETM